MQAMVKGVNKNKCYHEYKILYCKVVNIKNKFTQFVFSKAGKISPATLLHKQYTGCK